MENAKKIIHILALQMEFTWFDKIASPLARLANDEAASRRGKQAYSLDEIAVVLQIQIIFLPFDFSLFTFHVCRFTFHISLFTFHVSHFTFHVSPNYCFYSFHKNMYFRGLL